MKFTKLESGHYLDIERIESFGCRKEISSDNKEMFLIMLFDDKGGSWIHTTWNTEEEADKAMKTLAKAANTDHQVNYIVEDHGTAFG